MWNEQLQFANHNPKLSSNQTWLVSQLWSNNIDTSVTLLFLVRGRVGSHKATNTRANAVVADVRQGLYSRQTQTSIQAMSLTRFVFGVFNNWIHTSHSSLTYQISQNIFGFIQHAHLNHCLLTSTAGFNY